MASAIAGELGIDRKFTHLDSRTFSLQGVYNSEEKPVEEPVVHITKGYSKEKAAELNQVVPRQRHDDRAHAGLPVYPRIELFWKRTTPQEAVRNRASSPKEGVGF